MSVHYFRVKSLLNDAVRTLAIGRGRLRDRLQLVDQEAFCIPDKAVPEEVREEYAELKRLCRVKAPKHDEGVLHATFQQRRVDKLEEIARLIVDISDSIDYLSNQDGK